MSRRRKLAIVIACALSVSWGSVWAKPEVVNIEKPVNGVSHNHHDTFDIAKAGVILNNATSRVNTELAGMIDRNPKLQSPAELIIHEVKQGRNLSHLGGPLEVAGHKASVAIVNSNGIEVNGFRTINTNEVDLVAGRSLKDNREYELGTGSIHVGKDGIHSDRINLLGNQLSIDGPIRAKEIQIHTGTGIITKKLPDIDINQRPDTHTNQDAIQISPTGGMYGNHIFIVSEELGKNIQTKGTIEALEEAKLLSNGDITISGDTVAKKHTIKSKGDIHIEDPNLLSKQLSNSNLLEEDGVLPSWDSAHNIHNGERTVVVDIAKPSKGGISYNSMPLWHVGEEGVVFNNAAEDTSARLEKNIRANKNLEGQSARVIIAQATRDDVVARIVGPIEIAGKSANLVLANPKGIRIHKQAMFNVNRLTLLAGEVKYSPEGLVLVTRQGGEVFHNSRGSSYMPKQLDIVGDAVTLNSEIEKVSKVNILQGLGKASYETMHFSGDSWLSRDLDKESWKEGLYQLIRDSRKNSFLLFNKESSIAADAVHIESVGVSEDIKQRGLIHANHEVQLHTAYPFLNFGLIDSNHSSSMQSTIALFNQGIITSPEQRFKAHFVINEGQIIGDNLTFESSVFRNEKRWINGNYRRIHARELYENPTLVLIRGEDSIAIKGDDFMSEAKSEISSPQLIIEAKRVVNKGSLIGSEVVRIKANTIMNQPGEMMTKDRSLSNWENDPDRIEIDAPGHAMNHLIDLRSKFTNIGAKHSYEYHPTPNESVSFANYWAIFTKHQQFNTKFSNNDYASIEGKSIELHGKVTNQDSRIVADEDLRIYGSLENRATIAEKGILHDGHIEHWVPHATFHHFKHRTERRKISDEPYKEPDEITKYYAPAISYAVKRKVYMPVSYAYGEGLMEGEVIVSTKGKTLLVEVTDKSEPLYSRASSLLSGRTVSLQGSGLMHNEGTIMANTLTTEYDQVEQLGHIKADTITMKSKGELKNYGDIRAKNSVYLEGKEVLIERGEVQSREEISSNILGITSREGSVLIRADEDIRVVNQHIGAKNELILDAGKDVIVDRKTYAYRLGTPSENHAQVIEKDAGSFLESEGNMTLQAGRDIYVTGSALTSKEHTLRLLAGQDIHITTGKNVVDSHYYWSNKDRHGRTTVNESIYEKEPISTELLGDKIYLNAVRDINLLSSNSIDRHNTLMKAGRDITSAVDTTLKKYEYTKEVKGSGIRLGHGLFGIQIGSWKEIHKESGRNEEPVPTRITSTNGTVNLEAEGKIHATTTNIYGKDGVTLIGSSVILDGTQGRQEYHQYEKKSFTGFTIGLGGRAYENLNNAYVYINGAQKAHDRRLKTMKFVEGLSELGAGHLHDSKSWSKYWKDDGDKIPISLSVVFGKSQSEQNYDAVEVRYIGGKVKSEGPIHIEAKDAKNGKIQLIGETLEGSKIELIAHTIEMDSGTNTSTTTTTHKESEGHVGFDWGVGGSFAPNLGFSLGKGDGEEKMITYTPTLLRGNEVSIESGGNTSIHGSRTSWYFWWHRRSQY